MPKIGGLYRMNEKAIEFAGVISKEFLESVLTQVILVVDIDKKLDTNDHNIIHILVRDEVRQIDSFSFDLSFCPVLASRL